MMNRESTLALSRVELKANLWVQEATVGPFLVVKVPDTVDAFIIGTQVGQLLSARGYRVITYNSVLVDNELHVTLEIDEIDDMAALERDIVDIFEERGVEWSTNEKV